MVLWAEADKAAVAVKVMLKLAETPAVTPAGARVTLVTEAGGGPAGVVVVVVLGSVVLMTYEDAAAGT
jgi:hypothetical protein